MQFMTDSTGKIITFFPNKSTDTKRPESLWEKFIREDAKHDYRCKCPMCRPRVMTVSKNKAGGFLVR